MDRKHVHKYNAGVRVGDFFVERSDQFPDSSPAAPYIKKVNQDNGVIAGNFTAQASAWSRLIAANADRRAAGDALTADVHQLMATVRAVAVDDPSIRSRFTRKPGKGGQGLLATARAFRDQAQKDWKDLAAHALPDTFLTTFGGHIDAFAAAINEQNTAKDAHITARAATQEGVKGLMGNLKHLNAIVRNQFRGDATTLEAWKRARHVEVGPTPAAAPETPAAPAASANKVA